MNRIELFEDVFARSFSNKIADAEGVLDERGRKLPIALIGLSPIIHRYVTESSFDGYSWQALETKVKFIGQIMTGESSARRIEALDFSALTDAEVKAIASGTGKGLVGPLS